MDPLLNSEKDGYYLQSQDVMGTGSSIWDMFYYTVNAQNGILSMARKNNTYYQQFNIIPNDEFLIEDVQLSLLGGEITESKVILLRDGVVRNGGSVPMQRTLQFSESKTDANSFSESNGVTTRKSGSLNVNVTLAKVSFGGSATFEYGTQKTLQYGTNTSNSTTITEAFNITVPPGMVSTYKFNVMRHQVRLRYTARCRGIRTGKVMNISGIYSGVDYTTSTLDVTEQPIGRSANLAAPRTYTLTPN